MKKILILTMLLPLMLLAKTINIDSEKIEIHLKNNNVNILNFPFIIQKANLTTETPEDFNVKSKNYSVVITPTAEFPKKEVADMLIWSAQGDPYLIKLMVDGNTTQYFTMSSGVVNKYKNNKAARFETGKVESDIKRIIKKLVLGEKIPGYKKVNVKKKFLTEDLEMQKELYYDGGKYRAEQWFIENTSNDTLFLDYENFYAPGILAIAFEVKTLSPGDITKAWLIINKSTLKENRKGE